MLKNLFKLDLRSLALARLLLGVLAFFDLARRIPDIDVFFTDSGILPRWTLLEQFELNWQMSLLNLNGSYYFALMLLIIGMLASIFFALGWRTRVSNIIIWLVIVSFQARFPEGATSGGDMLLRIFLFLSFFLPMNARFSVDHAVSKAISQNNEYFSIFSCLWIVQIMLLYILTFLYKWAPVYHTDFDAVWFMLQLDIFTTPFGKWLGQYYAATKFLTFISYALEIIGPILLFVPWKRDAFRGLAVASFWLFHIGIGLTLHLGNFVPICLIIWVGLMPTTWWEFLAKNIAKVRDEKLILYYDEQSAFARQFAFIVKEMFMIEHLEIVSRKEDSFILIDDKNNSYSGTRLVSELLLNSRLFFIRYIGRLLKSELSAYLLEFKESGEINIFGKRENIKADDYQKTKLLSFTSSIVNVIGFGDIKMVLNRAEKMLGTLLLLLILGWNIEGYVEDREWYIGSPFDEVMFSLHLNQGWAMFAPHPQRSDGWWVLDGNLNNGKKWDALNHKEVTYDRPDDIYATYSSEDWRKFLDNLQASRDEKYLQFLSQFICRKWNSEHNENEALMSFKLHFMQEFTNGPDEPPAKVEKVTLWNHNCF